MKAYILLIALMLAGFSLATGKLQETEVQDPVSQSEITESAEPSVQPESESDAPDIQLQHIATLDGVEKNIEFKRNVDILQLQRNRVIELRKLVAQETDEALKTAYQEEFDQMLLKLSENNQKMIQAYGFSLERNYQMVIDVGHIYKYITEAELAELQEREAASKL